MERKAPSV